MKNEQKVDIVSLGPFVGDVTVVPDKIDRKSIAYKLGFCTGTQRTGSDPVGHAVFLRAYQCHMGRFVKILQTLGDQNVLKPCALLPVQGHAGRVVAYEPVNGNLAMFLEGRAKKPNENPKANQKSMTTSDDILVCRILRQLTNALSNAHKKGIFHGSLKCEDILITFDLRYPSSAVEYFNFSLSFSNHEAWYEDNPQEGEKMWHVSSADDWRALSEILNLLFSRLECSRNAEFANLSSTLKNNSNFDINVLNNHVAVWRETKKVLFVNFMASQIPEAANPRNFVEKNWMQYFNRHISIAANQCQQKNVKCPSYRNTLRSFVFFMQNTIKHAHEYDANAQATFGGTQGEIIRLFEGFYGGIFVDILTVAKQENLMAGFDSHSTLMY